MTAIHLLARDATGDALALTLQDCLGLSVFGWPVVVHADGPGLDAVRPLFAEHQGVTWTDSGLAVRQLAQSAGDVVLIQAGTRLGRGWDARLAGVARAEQDFDTVSPLCREIALHAPTALSLDGLPQDEADRKAFDTSRGVVWAVPFASPLCVWLRGKSLVALADADLTDLDERIAWLEASRQRGVVHGLTDALLVTTPTQVRAMHALDRMLDDWLDAFDQQSPLALQQARPTPFPPYALSGVPVQLHVMHSWGGGLERWVRDYCTGETTRINLVLKSIGNVGLYGQRLALYLDIDHSEPVEVWDFPLAIRGTDIHHAGYQQALTEIVQRYQVDAVIVSSLIGHSLDVLRTGLPTAHVLHEYYPYCPALYIHHRGEHCRQCEVHRLQECLQSNPINTLFRNVPAAEWLAVRSAYREVVVAQQVQLIAPSASVPAHYRELEPALVAHGIRVIEHGMAWHATSAKPAAAHSSGRLRLVVLGMLAEHKGLSLFKALQPRIADVADVILLGCGETGEQFAGQPGIEVIPRYERDRLPELLAELGVDAGLLLSIWPETFSYTLSELMCAGIAPIVPAHGAYPERVAEGQTGFLCPPTAETFAARIHALAANPALLERVRTQLADYRPRSLEDMVQDYRAALPLVAMGAGYVPHERGLAPRVASPFQRGIDARMPMREVLYELHAYLRAKIKHSPKLKGWRRRFASTTLELGMRVIYKAWRWLGGKA